LIRRAEIREVDLEPVPGWEANKRQPAVIVSSDAANGTAARLGRAVITVVPVASSAERVYPFQALLPAAATGLPRDSKAHAEQVRSADVDRIGERVGLVPPPLMEQIETALRVHLSL
jgi:mRNA interferase MazF